MKFFNVGTLEILFLLLLAFILLGPKQAVKTAADFGRWIRKLKNSQIWQDFISTSREIKDLPQKIMDDTEIEKTIAELDHSIMDTEKQLKGISKEVQNDKKDIQSDQPKQNEKS